MINQLLKQMWNWAGAVKTGHGIIAVRAAGHEASGPKKNHEGSRRAET
jgi:hypothetical protein